MCAAQEHTHLHIAAWRVVQVPQHEQVGQQVENERGHGDRQRAERDEDVGTVVGSGCVGVQQRGVRVREEAMRTESLGACMRRVHRRNRATQPLALNDAVRIGMLEAGRCCAASELRQRQA